MEKEEIDFKKYKKIAIMGGTFNPIHYAHLVCAEFVQNKFNMDKIIFIPTGEPPHKQNLATKKDRYLMTQLATLENENFLVSSIEIDRKGTTYTIDTLKEIKKLANFDIEIYFIIGIDAINQLFTWKDFEALFENTKFIVITRTGYEICQDIENIKPEFKEKMFFCEMPNIEISSTKIRDMVDNEESISYLVPKLVEKYILKNNLYKKNLEKKYEFYIEKIKQILPEKRFNHSLEVAKEAKKMAKNYGADEEKAFLAGVLHDCAKYYSKEKINEICLENSYELDETIKKQIDIAHSFIGYFVSKNEYGIEDFEILNAIKYHTTGKANMNLLEKIIYIADYIEPTRKYFKGLDKARYLAYKNIDKAMEYILENTIKFNEEKGREIHYLSKEAYEFYANKNREEQNG